VGAKLLIKVLAGQILQGVREPNKNKKKKKGSI
jgi:hypothetical protein